MTDTEKQVWIATYAQVAASFQVHGAPLTVPQAAAAAEAAYHAVERLAELERANFGTDPRRDPIYDAVRRARGDYE